MHPILGEHRALAVYLAGAGLLGLALAAALAVGVGSPSAEALALGLPLAVVLAFLCLAGWYPARAAPLASSGPLRIAATHLTAAAAMSTVWVLLARGWGRGLEELAGFEGAASRVARAGAALWGAGVLAYLLAVSLQYLLVAFQEARRAEAAALGALALQREAELRALRAQFSPHFLFNSLNTVSALLASDPDAARRVCHLLADLLRQSLRQGGRDRVSLAEDLALAAHLLEIERARFGRRLQVSEEVGVGARRCLVPPLLLQPLVENAITHGIAQLVEGGTVRLVAERLGDRLRLAVENPCDPERSRRPAARFAGASGLGLESVRARLEAAYGADATFQARERDGRFEVEMTLPAIEPDPELEDSGV